MFWSSRGRQAPVVGMVLVEGVDRGRGERERDPEQADQQLGRDHVADRAHAAEPHAAADRREQVPPVEAAGDARSRCARARGCPEWRSARSYIAGMCHSHMKPTYASTANAGWARNPARCSTVVQPARDRPQQPLGQPEDQQDRRDVEQQDVLDHVHHHQLVAEHVDRRDERGQDRQQPAANSARRPKPGGCGSPGLRAPSPADRGRAAPSAARRPARRARTTRRSWEPRLDIRADRQTPCARS